MATSQRHLVGMADTADVGSAEPVLFPPPGEMRVAAATREVPCTAAGVCIGPSTALGRRLDALWSVTTVLEVGMFARPP
jgi:hypothetical protein